MEVNIRGNPYEVEGDPTFWGWVTNNRWENSTYDAIDKFLTPDHVFMDLGAWIGPICLHAQTITKSVYAFEPDPVAFAILSRNVAPYPINLSQVAVADYTGKLLLGSGLLGASTTRVNPDAGGGIGAWDATQTCNVDCAPLQALDKLLLTDAPRFIKMDIEGAEELVLRDLTAFEKKPTLLISLHPFWWRDAPQVWANLRKLARSYQHVRNPSYIDQDLEITGNEKELLFVD